MALLPTTYRPIVTPERFARFGFEPSDMGGPAPVSLPAGVLPSAPTIMAAPAPAPVAAPPPPIMAAPAPAPYIPAVTPQLREASYTPQDMRTAGLLSERTMEPSEEFRRADPSFTRKISDSNTYYTDPATGFFYNEDASRVGQYFTTNRGGAATAKGASGFAEFNPNFEYRLINKATGDVVFSGTGAEGLTGVQGAAQRFAQEQGDKGDWAVEQFDPATGQATTVARDTKPSNIVGLIADIALPVAAGFIPGVGPILGAALGSAASSVAQGRSLTDTLLRAGLSAGGAFAGGQALGALGAPAASSTGGLLATGGILPTVGGGFSATLGGGLGSAVGSGLGSVASQAAQAVAPEIIVSGALNAAGAGLGSTVGAGLGSAAGSALGAAATGGGQAPAPQPAQPRPPVEITPEGNLILTGTPQAPGFNIVTGALPGLGAALPAAIPTTPDATPEIVVERNINDQANIDAATAAAIAAGVLPTGGVLPSGQTPTDGETTLKSGNSLLDEIIKYYSLGSGVLDALGGALGGGGSGQTTPYTSRLGAMPTFTRGAFTPFTGDYETYGFGPEFNFFGGQPAPTPSAPVFGLLPPAALPGSGIV